MKKYALPLALFSAVSLTACNEESASTAPAAEEASVTLEGADARLSYGIAYGLGARMAADSVPMDLNAFTAGLRDAIDGNEPRLTQEEIQAEMQAYQDKVTAEQQAAQAKAAEANAAASAEFLAENAQREGVTTTESGLQYEIIEAGDGPTPEADDTVEVHYRGTLVDGSEFDSSYGRGQSVKFGVSQVITGWTQALKMMPVGSKWKLYIPSDLAYGTAGAGSMIGPNAALVFEVELLDVIKPEADAAVGEG